MSASACALGQKCGLTSKKECRFHGECAHEKSIFTDSHFVKGLREYLQKDVSTGLVFIHRVLRCTSIYTQATRSFPRQIGASLIERRTLIQHIIFVLIAGSCLLCGCGMNSPLVRSQEICNKYPTPDARADCERRYKDIETAIQKQKDADARRERDAKGETVKPNDLCFRRQSTGELICPN